MIERNIKHNIKRNINKLYVVWGITLCMMLVPGLGRHLHGNDSDPGQKKAKALSITMFVPGINQLKSRQYIKGGLLLASFAGCIAGAVIHNNNGNNWYDKYMESTNVEEVVRFRQNTESAFKTRNLFLVGTFTVLLAHMIDLKFFKSKKGGVKGEVGKNCINLGFYYLF